MRVRWPRGMKGAHLSKARTGLAAVSAVGLVAAAIAVAEGGGARPDRAASFAPFPQHQVAGPSRSVGGSSSKVNASTGVRYVESDVFIIEHGAENEVSGSLKCPRRSAAIGGYFGNNKPGVVLDYSAIGPRSTRKWDFGVLYLNENTEPQARAFVGLVCIK
jgi:hypothetical protein